MGRVHGADAQRPRRVADFHAADPRRPEHYIHKGSLQTILGGLCGNRSLGDFLQMRVGPKGEAHIVYVDSNSISGSLLATHGMYVRQNGGTSVTLARARP